MAVKADSLWIAELTREREKRRKVEDANKELYDACKAACDCLQADKPSHTYICSVLFTLGAAMGMSETTAITTKGRDDE